MATDSTQSMFSHLDMVTLYVRDQQEALDWYTTNLDFEVRHDDPMPNGEGRWVAVGVPGQDDLLVALEPLERCPAESPEEREAVIGLNGFSLRTHDILATVETLRERNVEIVRGPDQAPWGTFILIDDLYGNTHHILEPAPQ